MKFEGFYRKGEENKMLNTINLNFLNKNNFKSALNKNSKNNGQNTYYGFSYNFNAPKLKPLAKDTISFLGTNSSQNLNKSLYDAFDNIEVCKKVSDNGARAEKLLRKTLNSALGEFKYDPKTNPEGIIYKISTRRKTADSIKEKLTNRLEGAILKDKSKIFNPTDADEIKSTLGDIIGARITLRNADDYQSKVVIDKIIEQVEKGNLKIINIENHEPDEIRKNLKYFAQEDLQRLEDAVNRNRPSNLPAVKVKTDTKDSGYMALHLDLDLSNDNFTASQDKYLGEIQIVGYDVECLKEVEDLTYKLLQNKSIKAGHPAYSAFTSYWKKYSESKDYPDFKDDFTLYTARAYLMQREKEPVSAENKNKKALPTIRQCGLEKKIPPELDFNRLKEIKALCDQLYELTKRVW